MGVTQWTSEGLTGYELVAMLGKGEISIEEDHYKKEEVFLFPVALEPP